MKIRHLIFIVLFLFADSSYGQSSDTGKVSRIIKYGEAIYDSKPDSALLLFKNAEILADKYLNSEKNAKFLFSLSQLKSLAINNQGFLLYEDDVNAALVKFLYALKIREQISDLKNLPESYANLGVLYTNLSQFDKALFYSFKVPP